MKKTKRSIDWMELLVFVLLSLCILQVLLTAAGAYRRLVDRGEELQNRQSAIHYLSTRVFQAQGVAVEDFCGCPALVLEETVGDQLYVTRVYLWEGQLRELFSRYDAPLEPQDGERLLPVQSLELQLEDGLLTVVLDGRTLLLSVDPGKEVPG